jgi:hypothetical protein
MAAREVDFANHAPANERRRFRRYHVADKFMPRRASEIVVPALQFKIRVTDSCKPRLSDANPAGRFGSSMSRIESAPDSTWTAIIPSR